jgi:flagellar motor switch protein FliN/FliY
MNESSIMQDPVEYEKSLEEVRHYADIPLKVTIELGRREMRVREILQLKEGYILELPRSAGENIDVHVNGKLVGYGEVLEMEGSAGIRLTDLHAKS